MGLIRAFWRLDARRRVLVAEAGALLLLARIGLHLCSYTWLHRALNDLASRTPARTASLKNLHLDVAWAVTAAAHRLPLKMTCLMEALATDTMLRRRGHLSQLRFGVRRGDPTRLDAHAWVECEGDLVIGILNDLKDYEVLV